MIGLMVGRPRPVVCHVCQQPMYYVGDPRFEPEIDLEFVRPSEPNTVHAIYLHDRCYRTLHVVSHFGRPDPIGAGTRPESGVNAAKRSESSNPSSAAVAKVWKDFEHVFEEFEHTMDSIFGRRHR